MRLYRYIGPARLLAQVTPGGVAPVTTEGELAAWLRGHPEAWREPLTFVVDAAGRLRMAPRRSEHVACAGGEPVLAAGELQLGRGRGGRVEIAWASNQSTGYAPEPASFAALASAARLVGMDVPDGYDPAFDFRRCEGCGQLALIKDDDWSCAACGRELPRGWNAGLDYVWKFGVRRYTCLIAARLDRCAAVAFSLFTLCGQRGVGAAPRAPGGKGDRGL